MSDEVERIRIGDADVDLLRHRVTRAGAEEALSPQEVQILRVFVRRGTAATVTRLALYQEAWGYRTEPQGRALDYAVRRLRSKLGVEEPEGPVLGTIRGVGYQLVWQPADAPAPPAAPSSLPRPPAEGVGDLLGRGEALSTLRAAAAVARPALVTGGVGSGKSALLRAAAAGWAGPVLAVDLEGRGTAEEVTSALRVALGLGALGATPQAQVREALARREGALLVIDHADGATGEVSALVRDLVARRASVAVWIGSGVAVDGVGVTVELGPLDPDAATELWVRALAEAGVSVEPDDPTVQALVRVTDRWPLWIRLAATRARLYPLPALAPAIGNDPSLLASGDARARLASQVAALDAPTQRALAACASFEGAFDLDAIGAVADPDAWAALEGLRARSLLLRGADGALSVLRPLRQVVRSQSAILDPDGLLALRHARWVASAVEPLLARLDETGGDRRLRAVDALLPELRVAQDRVSDPVLLARLGRAAAIFGRRTGDPDAVARGLRPVAGSGPEALALRLEQLATRSDIGEPTLPALRALALELDVHAPALAPRGRALIAQRENLEAGLSEGLATLAQITAGTPVDPVVAAEVAIRRALLLHDHHRDAAAAAAEALRLALRTPNRRLQAQARQLIGLTARLERRFDEARAMLVAARADYDAIGDATGALTTLVNLGLVEKAAGQFRAAAALQDQARVQASAYGLRRTEVVAATNLGALWIVLGDLDAARSLLEGCYASFCALGERPGQAASAEHLACIELLAERPQRADERIADALAAFGGPPYQLNQASVLDKRVFSVLLRGDVPAASAALAELRAVAGESPVVRTLAPVLAVLSGDSAPAALDAAAGAEEEFALWREGLLARGNPAATAAFRARVSALSRHPDGWPLGPRLVAAVASRLCEPG